MDLNVHKMPVRIKETVFEQTAEQSVDADFTLPDYCPPISRILKCRMVPRAASKTADGRGFTVDGSVSINVIYADAAGNVFSYEHICPFSKTFDTGTVINVTAKCSVRTEYVNCRAVNERKIDVHGQLRVFLKLLEDKSTDIVVDVEGDGIEKNCGTLRTLCSVTSAEKSVTVEEELELGQGQPSVKCILRYDTAASVREFKVISNKVVAKGELCITVLYSAADTCRYQTYRASIPFSGILEAEGINEDCKCDVSVQVCFAELKPRTDVNGEVRTMSLTAKLLVSADGYCDSEVPVVLDAYSLCNETTAEKCDISAVRVAENANGSFIYKNVFSFQGSNLGNMIDLWCDTAVTGTEIKDSELTVFFCVTVCALAYDTDGTVIYLEKQAESEHRQTLNVKTQSAFCDPSLETVSVGYTLLNENEIEVRSEYSLTAAVCEKPKTRMLSSLSVSDTVKKPKNTASLAVCYAERGDDVWDIAKRYNGSVSEIFTVNGIEEQILKSDTVLLVPIK